MFLPSGRKSPYRLLIFCVLGDLGVLGVLEVLGVYEDGIAIFHTFFVVIATSFASLVLTDLHNFLSLNKIHSFWNMIRLFRAAKPTTTTTTTTTTNRTFNHHFTSFFTFFCLYITIYITSFFSRGKLYCIRFRTVKNTLKILEIFIYTLFQKRNRATT